MWIFGGVVRGTYGRNCFMVEVEHRNAETLLPLIQQYIRPGSTIASDFWRAYFRIDQLPQGFHHVQVNHSENFVDPQNPDIHT